MSSHTRTNADPTFPGCGRRSDKVALADQTAYLTTTLGQAEPSQRCHMLATVPPRRQPDVGTSPTRAADATLPIERIRCE